MSTPVKHLMLSSRGDAAKLGIGCGAKEVKTEYRKNWFWSPELVTCKRCLAIHEKRSKSREAK